jgi:hypothetical protein
MSTRPLRVTTWRGLTGEPAASYGLRMAERPAPVLPGERWVCMVCPWVNDSGDRCARCGRPRPKIEPRPAPPSRLDQPLPRGRRTAPAPLPFLVIVARDAPETYDYVARKFGKAGVEIIVDRRVGERRSREVAPAVERRQASRRVRPSVADELQVNRWTLVRTS